MIEQLYYGAKTYYLEGEPIIFPE